MKKLSGIKAIFFDIDDTLFPSTEFAALARRNAVRAMIEAGMKADSEKALVKLGAIVKKKGSNYDRHLNDLADYFGHKNDYKVIAAGIAAYHNTKGSIMPFPEVPRTLLSLRDRGFLIYAATKGNALKQWDKLIRLGLHLIFHDVFVSEELGVEKSPEFYSKILKRLKLSPSETVMVGDRLDKDIVASKEAGMFAVRVLKGKYAKEKQGKLVGVRADCEIRDLNELLSILDKPKKK